MLLEEHIMPLQSVDLQLPNFDQAFGDKFLSLLAPFGRRSDNTLRFTPSNPNFLPQIAFKLSDTTPKAIFNLSGETIEIDIANKTGQQKQSPETYRPIPIGECTDRLQNTELVRLDHIGFNLPWFKDVHPDILMLRQELAARCAYFRFPTGEEWDFIIPATTEEISAKDIDLTKDRYPKLEIVSFDKASTPLIQIDFSVRRPFTELIQLFPEGIADAELKNVWVYLKNPYDIDICLIIGEHKDGDWSDFFEGHRL